MENITLITWALAMLGAGAVGGLLAGLLGVGGGIVIVPVLYQILTTMDVPDIFRMKIAVGSSLATIIVTSYISSRAHSKKGNVDWDLFKSWAPWIFVGVLIGIAISSFVSGVVLTAVFAVVAMVVALDMLFRNRQDGIFNGFPSKAIKSLIAIVIGSISTLMGIGGGTLSVPILNIFGYNIKKAVGTGAGIGMLIAIPATIGYLVQGIGVDGLPPFSLGYLNLLAIIFIIPMTTLMAPYGAKIAHAIPDQLLRKLFSLFLALTSIRMFYDLAT